MRRRIALPIVLAAAVIAAACGRNGSSGPTQSTAGDRGALEPDPDHLVTDEMVAEAIARARPDQWYGLYMGGKKVGWARLALRKAQPSEPGGITAEVDAVMRVAPFEGEPGSELAMEERRFYEANPPYRLVALHSIERNAGSPPRERKITVRDGEMVIGEVERGGLVEKRRVPRSAETLHSTVAEIYLDPAWAAAGRSQTFPSFDMELQRDQNETVKVVDVVRQRVAGVDVAIAVLESSTEGEAGITTIRMAAGGVVIETGMGGMMLRLEERAVAQSDVVGFDIIGDAVDIDRGLGDPAGIDRLDLVIGVSDGFQLPSAPNQRVSRRADGRYDVTLTVGPGAGATERDRKAALAETGAIDHGDPDIRQLADRITAGARTDREKVELLVTWVYANLEKELSTNLSSASLVEEKRRGDCTEHTLLLAALARAERIPAREVSGLIYMGDSFRKFGYHAWVEVALDGRWIAVDPSWGETAANATHIAFGYGEDSSWVMTLGSVSIALD